MSHKTKPEVMKLRKDGERWGVLIRMREIEERKGSIVGIYYICAWDCQIKLLFRKVNQKETRSLRLRKE